jgi:hypothetical protein
MSLTECVKLYVPVCGLFAYCTATLVSSSFQCFTILYSDLIIIFTESF